MPLYEFWCDNCKTSTERVQKLAEATQRIKCKCGKMAKKVVGSSILRDEPTWLPDSRRQLQYSDEKPFETRSEYKRYLKQHNIIERC